MDDRLRRSTAHVLVADVAAPAPDEPTWHHLRRVLRLRDGAPVTVTDGAGGWRACRLTSGGVEADGDAVFVPSPSPSLTLAVAPPKGDRTDWLVEKCTEVGVDRIVLLHASRSVVRWDQERVPRHLDRLRRVATSAALQSRRVWLPALEGPLAAGDVLEGVAIAEPGGRPLGSGHATVAIGPEGGWTPEEVALGEAVSLGPTVLRVETAAVAAAVRMVAQRDTQ